MIASMVKDNHPQISQTTNLHVKSNTATNSPTKQPKLVAKIKLNAIRPND